MKASSALALLALPVAAHSYDVRLQWDEPQYDVDGTPIEQSMLYQVYSRRDDEAFTKAGGEVSGTTTTIMGIAAGCIEFYVTARFAASVESDPSNSVLHCTEAVEDASVPEEPQPPVILNITSETGADPEPETSRNDWSNWRNWRNR